jgi:hypothetical protein
MLVVLKLEHNMFMNGEINLSIFLFFLKMNIVIYDESYSYFTRLLMAFEIYLNNRKCGYSYDFDI